MRDELFRGWLESQPLKKKTIGTVITDARRVEREHGIDLDREYERDRLSAVRERLSYTADDERHNRANVSGLSIPRNNIRRTLPSYKTAVSKYAVFRAANN